LAVNLSQVINWPQKGGGLTLSRRIIFALAMITAVALIVYLDRSGYQDANGDNISLLDAFYYSTVSVTTTGYGDIVPKTDLARLITTVLVTPARVIFLILLVGTTLELLFGKFARSFRRDQWRKKLTDHYLICGYGVKGRAAAKRLLDHGVNSKNIVVLDCGKEEIARANKDGLVAILGSSSVRETLEEVNVDRAKNVILSLSSDDQTLLAVLRIREVTTTVPIIASCRDDINREALRRAGADIVILSAGAAGRLLGLAGETPRTAEMLEDILNPESGLDIIEKDGPAGDDEILLGVIQNNKLYRWPYLDGVHKQTGDRIIVLKNNTKKDRYK
jgi:voltage-gated potassium channel